MLLVNGYALLLMWLDKKAAIERKWRVPEASLLWTAAWGGAFGMLLAMLGLRHKTKHISFCIIVPLCLLCYVAGSTYIWKNLPF